MNAIIYARVSTDEQADKGCSLPTQIEACRKYAAERGFAVVAEYADDYTGAVPLETRPEGRRAYAMLRSSEADVMIAYRMDRLARPPEDGDEWDMPVLIRGLARLGKELHTCNRGQLKTSFADLLIAMLDARKAGEERRDIAERTSRGRIGWAKRGRVIRMPKPPYGYVYADGRLEVVEAEAAIVRMIFRWYTVGDDGDGNEQKPMVDNAIAHKLSRLRVSAPGEKFAGRRRQPGMWSPYTVRGILVRETYAGVWHYGKRIGRNGHGGQRPKAEQIAVSVPAIVARDVWQAAQERRAYNKRMSKRNCRRPYLLRGMITCGCGRAMSGGIHHSRAWRYHCNRRGGRYTELEGRECAEGYVRGDVLESVVRDYIMSVMNDGAVFEEGLRQAQDAEQSTLEPKRERLAAVSELIGHCEADARGLAAALAGIKAGGIMGAALQERVSYIEEQHAALQRERDALEQALQAQALTDDDVARALQLRAEVVAGMANPTFEERRRVLEFLRVAVVIKDHVATVSCRLPMGVGVFDLSTS